MNDRTMMATHCALLMACVFIAQPGAAKQKTTFHILSNPGSSQTCYQHVERCIVPVYVHSAPNSAECTAYIDAGTIIVPKPGPDENGNTYSFNNIKVVLVLKRGDVSTEITQYAFDVTGSTRGISVTDATQRAEEGFQFKDPEADDDDGTNTDEDMNASNRRLRWKSTHKFHHDGMGNPTIPINFTPVILRTSGGQTKTCLASDPTITNTNHPSHSILENLIRKRNRGH